MSGFDWVKARNECSAANDFKRLAEAVCKDMKARIKQDDSLKHRLEYRDRGADEFAVRKRDSHEIVFSRINETIEISYVHQSGAEERLLAVTVGMNEQGGNAP